MRKQPQPIIKSLAVGGLAILFMTMATSPAWSKECVEWTIPGNVEVTRAWCDEYETDKYPCSCSKWKYEKATATASEEPGMKDKIKKAVSVLNPKTWGDRAANWLKSELDKVN